jgi:hypothetical protein
VVFDFVYKAVFGAVWGVCFGMLEQLWLQRIFNSPVIEITVTLATAYLTFFSAEVIGCSGVLAVVALGLYMSKEGKASVSPEVGHFLDEFWEMLAYFGNTVRPARRAASTGTRGGGALAPTRLLGSSARMVRNGPPSVAPGHRPRRTARLCACVSMGCLSVSHEPGVGRRWP